MNEKLKEKLNHLNSYNFPLIFIGIGGGGTKIAHHFHNNGIKGNFIIINNHFPEDINDKITKIYYNPTQIPVVEGTKYFISDYSKAPVIDEKIQNIFNDQSFFVFLTALGGYTGTLVLDKILDCFFKNKNNYCIYSNTPLSFENKNRHKLSNEFQNKHFFNPYFNCISLKQIEYSYQVKNENPSLSDLFENVQKLMMANYISTAFDYFKTKLYE